MIQYIKRCQMQIKCKLQHISFGFLLNRAASRVDLSLCIVHLLRLLFLFCFISLRATTWITVHNDISKRFFTVDRRAFVCVNPVASIWKINILWLLIKTNLIKFHQISVVWGWWKVWGSIRGSFPRQIDHFRHEVKLTSDDPSKMKENERLFKLQTKWCEANYLFYQFITES